MRLQSPMFAFKPSATFRPSEKERAGDFKDRYLPSGVPSTPNLLEPLKSDPTVQGARPRLSAARLSRLDTLANAPVSNAPTTKVNESRVFRALPAISSRVRYARPNVQAGKPSVIASLDIEIAPFSADKVKLTDIDMQLFDGSSEDLGMSRIPMLPLICQPKDNPVFLFRLTPYDTPSNGSNQTSAKTVLITVHAIVMVSSSCQPKIQMRWKTGVDFSTALNPMYGAPAQSMQRQRRPSSLSRAGSNTNLSSVSASNREADSTVGDTKTWRHVISASDCDVSMTSTAPKKAVVGRPFSWHILVVNRSSEPRRLVLKVVSQCKDGVTKVHLPKPPLSPAVGYKATGTADSVIDESSLYALQRIMAPNKEQVLSLSTDVGTGYVSGLDLRPI